MIKIGKEKNHFKIFFKETHGTFILKNHVFCFYEMLPINSKNIHFLIDVN